MPANSNHDITSGNKEYRPRPGEAEVHEIRLPDEWGQQLLDDLVNQEEYLETQEDFKREFPGLAFVPDATGQCISGFLVNDSSMCLTLRYHEVSTERTEQEITFSVNTEYAYTGIQHDCTDSPLSEKPITNNETTAFILLIPGLPGCPALVGTE